MTEGDGNDSTPKQASGLTDKELKSVLWTPRAEENKKPNIKNKNVGEGRQFLWTRRHKVGG
jgi:hypothetical protein